MEKVYITKVLKGKEPIHAIGMVDIEGKKLYVPFVSKKKDLPIIDIVDIDYINKVEDGYRCEEVVVTEEGRHFINVYFATKLK